MATSVKVATPIPSPKQVARRLGISPQRHESIANLAQDAVMRYYRRSAVSVARKSTPKRAKAA